jgi:hypothetical protein
MLNGAVVLDLAITAVVVGEEKTLGETISAVQPPPKMTMASFRLAWLML